MGQTQTHNAIACFVPSSNNGIKGTVKFHQNGKCEIKLQGLIPNHTHAIHIHEFGINTTVHLDYFDFGLTFKMPFGKNSGNRPQLRNTAAA